MVKKRKTLWLFQDDSNFEAPKTIMKCSSSPVEQDKLPHLSHQHKRETDVIS